MRWKQQVCFISGYITPLQHCHILFESSLHLQNNGSKLNLNLFHKSQFTFKLRLNRKYLSRLSPRAAWTVFCRKTKLCLKSIQTTSTSTTSTRSPNDYHPTDALHKCFEHTDKRMHRSVLYLTKDKTEV